MHICTGLSVHPTATFGFGNTFNIFIEGNGVGTVHVLAGTKPKQKILSGKNIHYTKWQNKGVNEKKKLRSEIKEFEAENSFNPHDTYRILQNTKAHIRVLLAFNDDCIPVQFLAANQIHTALSTYSIESMKTRYYEKFLVLKENFHYCLDKRESGF